MLAAELLVWLKGPRARRRMADKESVQMRSDVLLGLLLMQKRTALSMAVSSAWRELLSFPAGDVMMVSASSAIMMAPLPPLRLPSETEPSVHATMSAVSRLASMSSAALCRTAGLNLLAALRRASVLKVTLTCLLSHGGIAQSRTRSLGSRSSSLTTSGSMATLLQHPRTSL